MELTVLGKYGPYPVKNGACSSYLLKTGDSKIVMDMGAGSLTRLLNWSRPEQLSALILSHLHYDHMSDALILRYALEAARRQGWTGKLPVYLPEQPEKERALLNSDVFEFHTVSDGSSFKMKEIELEFNKMTHPVPSFGVRIKSEGRTFCYTGDTNLNDTIIPFLKDCDFALIEAGFLQRDLLPGAPHLSVLEAAQCAKKAGVKRLLLTHQNPGVTAEQMLEEACREYPNSQVAEELKTYQI